MESTCREDRYLANKAMGKREQQAARRREQLLETALAQFTERGYRATSVRDITRAAGVTEAVLYHYFDSKSNLLMAVMARYSPFAQYRQIIAEAGNASVEQILTSLGGEFLRLMRERRSFVLTLLSEAPADPEIAAVLSGVLNSVVEDIAGFLSRQQGIDAELDVRVVGAALQGGLLVHFLSTALIPPAEGAPLNDDQVVAQLVRLLLDGLNPHGSQKQPDPGR